LYNLVRELEKTIRMSSTAMSGRAGRNFFKAVIGALKRLVATPE